MKKILMLVSIIFLVGCASNSELESALAEIENLESQITQKDAYSEDLDNQVHYLNESLDSLQNDYDAIKTELDQKEDQSLNEKNLLPNYLCDVQIENMKYENSYSAIAILDGWFALQPGVGSLQGTYTTTFWDNVESKIHTIRYISAEDNLSTTDSFMVFFEEARWKEGILWLTKQCWLDYPH